MYVFNTTVEQFRTGWFIESIVSASIIVLVIRSRQPFFKSVPGKYLVIATTCVAIAALIIPYTPLSGLLGFTPVSFWMLLAVAIIVAAYILITEIAKKWFYKVVKN